MSWATTTLVLLAVLLGARVPQESGKAPVAPAKARPGVASAEGSSVERDPSAGAALASRTTPDLIRLSRWCAGRGHTAEEARLLREVLRRDPADTVVRDRLAEIEPGDPAGTDRSPQEVPDAHEALAAAQASARALEQEVNALFLEVIDKEPARRDVALKRLRDVCVRESLPELTEYAEQLHREAGRFWRGGGVAILEMRPQVTSLVGMRERTAGLGVGSPVRFQLPETRSVRIGTTVGVPLGK